MVLVGKNLFSIIFSAIEKKKSEKRRELKKYRKKREKENTEKLKRKSIDFNEDSFNNIYKI